MKRYGVRQQQLVDTEANWNQTDEFVPFDGELVIYKADENNQQPRIKIGNGETDVKSLGFFSGGEGGSIQNELETLRITDSLYLFTKDGTSLTGYIQLMAQGNQEDSSECLVIDSISGALRIVGVSDPIGVFDVANKNYIDTQIGSINTALDRILSIQNSLIGSGV